MLVGLLVFFAPGPPAERPLRAGLTARVRAVRGRLRIACVLAQVEISAINTALTAVYLLGILPLLDVPLPSRGPSSRSPSSPASSRSPETSSRTRSSSSSRSAWRLGRGRVPRSSSSRSTSSSTSSTRRSSAGGSARPRGRSSSPSSSSRWRSASSGRGGADRLRLGQGGAGRPGSRLSAGEARRSAADAGLPATPPRRVDEIRYPPGR